MKKFLRIFVVLLAVLTFSTSCILIFGDGDGDDEFDGILEGTVTVVDAADWANLKIGLFENSDSSGDDSYYLKSGGYTSATSNRMYYSHNYDDSDNYFTPIATGVISGSGLERNYSITFPDAENQSVGDDFILAT